jgi:hypothetical protein
VAEGLRVRRMPAVQHLAATDGAVQGHAGGRGAHAAAVRFDAGQSTPQLHQSQKHDNLKPARGLVPIDAAGRQTEEATASGDRARDGGRYARACGSV